MISYLKLSSRTKLQRLFRKTSPISIILTMFVFYLTACQNIPTEPEVNIRATIVWDLTGDSTSNIETSFWSGFRLPPISASYNGREINLVRSADNYCSNYAYSYHKEVYDSCQYTFTVNSNSTTATIYPPGKCGSVFIDTTNIKFETTYAIDSGSHSLRWNKIEGAATYFLLLTYTKYYADTNYQDWITTADTFATLSAITSYPNLYVKLSSRRWDPDIKNNIKGLTINFSIQRDYKELRFKTSH